VGCGKIATRGHLPALKKLELEGLLELVAVADISERAARRAAKAFNVPDYHARPEDVAARGDVDAVCICTPTPTHAGLALLFARSGKHVLVERPLCMTFEEAREIERAVREAGVKICVVQNYRYLRAPRAARALVRAGRLGRVLSMLGVLLRPFPVRWTRSLWLYEDGGVIYDNGPHLVDMVLWLKGIREPEGVRAVHATGGDLIGPAGFVNHAQALIEFKDGTSASVGFSWLVGMEEFLIHAYGTGGSLIIDVLNDVLVEEHGYLSPFDLFRRYREAFKHLLSSLLTGRNPYDKPMQVYPALITDFVKAVEGSGRMPVSLGEAMATVLVLDEVRRQLAGRRAGEV